MFKTAWYPRYEVPGELETMPQPSIIPGAVIECGEWKRSKKAACDTDVFPCLFNIEQGTSCCLFLSQTAYFIPLFFVGQPAVR